MMQSIYKIHKKIKLLF